MGQSKVTFDPHSLVNLDEKKERKFHTVVSQKRIRDKQRQEAARVEREEYKRVHGHYPPRKVPGPDRRFSPRKSGQSG